MDRKPIAMVALLALAACAQEMSDAPQATYYHGMRLVPGDGSPAIENAALVVREGTIEALGPANETEPPEGAVEVDLSGRTVMPHLRSLHVHVGYLTESTMAAEHYSRESILEDLERYLHHGVGSVLVLGSDAGNVAFQIREDQRAGTVGGADLFTAGRGITAEGGWPTQIGAISAAPQQVKTEEEAREAVRGLAENDVDAVKIWVDDGGGRIPKIAPELYGAAIDEARKLGIPVVAHVFYLDDAKKLVEAGVSGLVHSIRDREVDDELVAAMKEKDVFYVPTLSAHQAGFVYADDPEWLGEPAMRETVSDGVIETLQGEELVESLRSNPALADQREQYRIAEVNVKKLSDAGVRIGLGTDSGTTNRFPGYFEHRELELMVEAGLAPQQAIQAGTSIPAAVLGIEGTLAPGNPSDFLVVRGNPLEDIRSTREIDRVIVAGEAIRGGEATDE